MKFLNLLCVCFMITPGLLATKDRLTVVMQWTQVDFYDSQVERNESIANGTFIPINNVIMGGEAVHLENNVTKYFPTIPRSSDGVPASLTVVKVNTFARNILNPKLTPYPSWDWHKNPPNCNENHLASVFRTWHDECGRLWVLDSGKISGKRICNPQLIAFDPTTDQVLHKFVIPSTDYSCNSDLIKPIVDIRDSTKCDETFVYMADAHGYGIIVYDLKNNRSWRVNNDLFYPYPNAGHTEIAGETFNLMEGLFTLALSPLKFDTDRTLYFHAYASFTENTVSTSVIRNETLFKNNPDASYKSFRSEKCIRNSQATAQDMDRNGNLFFGSAKETTIVAWNSETTYERRNFKIVALNNETLQFASDVRVINKPNSNDTDQDLLVTTNRFQKVATGTLNPNEINFRIQIGSIRELLIHSEAVPFSHWQCV